MVQIQATNGRGRELLTVLFVLWGLGDLMLSVLAALGAGTLAAIGIILMWMGGVLFFGIAALLAPVSFAIKGAVPIYIAETPPAPPTPF